MQVLGIGGVVSTRIFDAPAGWSLYLCRRRYRINRSWPPGLVPYGCAPERVGYDASEG